MCEFPDGEQPCNVDRYGFHAIGSGKKIATHMLLRSNYTKHFPHPTAVFHLAAAKYVAESAYVGGTTKMFVLKKDGSVLKTDEAAVRSLWQDTFRFPHDIESKMPQFQQI